MNKRWQVGIGTVLAIALGIILLVPQWRAALRSFLGGGEEEQTYADKPTSYWVEEMRKISSESFSVLGQGGVEAIPVLLEAAKVDDSTVYSMVLAMLYPIVRKDPEAALPHLILALKDDNRNVRLVALRGIGEMINTAYHRKPRPIPRLVGQAEDVRVAIPQPTVPTAQPMQEPSWRPDLIALPALVEALEDDEAMVRMRVLVVLSLIGPDAKEAVPGLIKCMKDRNEDVRSLAVSALEKLGPEARPAIPAMLEALHDNSPAIQTQSCAALAEFAPEVGPTVVPVMLDHLKARLQRGADLQPTANAIKNMLVRMGTEAQTAVPTLLDMVRSGNTDAQTAVIPVLAALGPKAQDAVPVLQAMLKADEIGIRTGSAEALYHIDRQAAKAAVPLLQRIIQDKKAKLWQQAEAARILVLLDPEQGGTTAKRFIALLEAGTAAERVQASTILAGMGTSAKAAVPGLVRALQDKEGSVRAAASRALQAIDPKAAATQFAGAAHDRQVEKLYVFVGTYTAGGASKGIYRFDMDLASGKLSDGQIAAEAINPSFLAIHPNQRFIYAVSEIDDLNGKKSGGVSAFAIDPKGPKLTLLNQQPSGGAGPCHLVVDRQGKHVLVANYGSSASVLPIQEDGRLGEATSFVQHRGNSVDPQRQEGPHAHSINLDASNRFAFVADLGLDKVLIYRFDETKGTLTPNDPPSAAVGGGAGPRHFAFHPDGSYAYVINEMQSTVTAFAYDAQRGILKTLQTISALPERFSGKSWTAEIQVHPSGRFLYGSNRGHDSIAIFAIDPKTGKLRLLGHQSQGIKTPRNFGIDPTGTYLLVANQDGNSVLVFRINLETGELTPTGTKVEVPMPVCVKMMPRSP